jgi:hypothetical protein
MVEAHEHDQLEISASGPSVLAMGICADETTHSAVRDIMPSVDAVEDS